MDCISFHVPGKPQGKARARTFYNPNMKRHMSVTPDNTVLYENLIKQMYIDARGLYFERDIPLKLCIVARFGIPNSKSKKIKQQMLDGYILPIKKPDMDNIVKVVADALNGVAYHDDTQIVYVEAKKVYSSIEGLDVTLKPYRKE